MKPTLRSRLWRYGPLVCIGGTMLLLIAWPVAHMTGIRWPTNIFSVALLAFTVYHILLVRKYPTFGDLPECREYLRQVQQRYARSDENLQEESP